MTSQNVTVNQTIDPKELRKKVISRFVMAVLVLGAVFFIPAGSLNYWEAWVYMAILIIPMGVVMLYLIKKDPELLDRRLRMKEKETQQSLLVKLNLPLFLAAYLIPGLDKRYGWSEVPLAMVILADILIFIGYLLFVLVLRENRYASRVIEVEQQQKVITTGPYAIVRHPMYVAILLIYIFSPLALGSFWALIPMCLVTLLLIARILNEEKVLCQELKGYREYTGRTKYRLIPGIW